MNGSQLGNNSQPTTSVNSRSEQLCSPSIIKDQLSPFPIPLLAHPHLWLARLLTLFLTITHAKFSSYSTSCIDHCMHIWFKFIHNNCENNYNDTIHNTWLQSWFMYFAWLGRTSDRLSICYTKCLSRVRFNKMLTFCRQNFQMCFFIVNCSTLNQILALV